MEGGFQYLRAATSIWVLSYLDTAKMTPDFRHRNSLSCFMGIHLPLVARVEYPLSYPPTLYLPPNAESS
jgi:hypothetical protein